jgi:hypothetical protein
VNISGLPRSYYCKVSKYLNTQKIILGIKHDK